MDARTARCACVALTATARGEPIRLSVCHCLDGKRRTGSALSWNAHWPDGKVAIDGDYASYNRSSDDGCWVRLHFWPACGTIVFYQIEQRPGVISSPVGDFADPEFPAPRIEVHEARRCPWLPALAPIQDDRLWAWSRY